MTAQPPDAWQEVFRGPCVEADLVQAVLEANGLEPMTRAFGPQTWWSGSVFEDCRVYVPEGQVAEAREVLARADSAG